MTDRNGLLPDAQLAVAKLLVRVNALEAENAQLRETVTQRDGSIDALVAAVADLDDVNARLRGDADRPDCHLLDDDERMNPHVASCGAEFDIYEAMAAHERKHRDARARRET